MEARESASGPLKGGSVIDYVPALDGLRGIAILLVVWYHALEVLELGEIWRESLFWHLSMGGAMGVDLFFGVSGFLITSILLETRRQQRSLVKFWARRALRIFPLHYLYLIVLVVVSMTIPDLLQAPIAVEGTGWIPYFLYVGNIAILLMGDVGTPLIILWSLAIEEQFYLVWPFVVSRLSPREVAKFCAAGIVLAPLIRLFAQYGEDSVQTAFYFTLCRVDPIFWGALIAVAVRDETWRTRLQRVGSKLAIPLVVTALTLFYWTGTSEFRIDLGFTVVGHTIAALAVAAAVVLALYPGRRVQRLLESTPLVWVGRRCYGIYIWHVLLGFAITASLGEEFLALPALIGLALWIVATFIVAEISWRAFERPMLAFKRHFAYADSEDNPLPDGRKH